MGQCARVFKRRETLFNTLKLRWNDPISNWNNGNNKGKLELKSCLKKSEEWRKPLKDMKLYAMTVCDDLLLVGSFTFLFLHSIPESKRLCQYSGDYNVKLTTELNMFKTGEDYWVLSHVQDRDFLTVFKIKLGEDCAIERIRDIIVGRNIATWDFKLPFLVLGTSEDEIIAAQVFVDPTNITFGEKCGYFNDISEDFYLGKLAILKSNTSLVFSTHAMNNFQVRNMETEQVLYTITGCLCLESSQRYDVSAIDQNEFMLIVGFRSLSIEIYDSSMAHLRLTLVKTIHLESATSNFARSPTYGELWTIAVNHRGDEILLGTAKGLFMVGISEGRSKHEKERQDPVPRVWFDDPGGKDVKGRDYLPDNLRKQRDPPETKVQEEES